MFWRHSINLAAVAVVIAGGLLALAGLNALNHQSGKNSPGQPQSNQSTAPHSPKAMPPSLPGGGRVLFPKYQLVALYGFPDSPALGALGDQPLPATMKRVHQLAAEYQTYSTATVMPTLEIIATTASASPTDNGDYSREATTAELLPWVLAAQRSGVYVVLDLQPGRSDFLTQAKRYVSLLKYPNVGLALDPEWRLAPDQVHLAQIGTVDAAEINRTGAWLATLTTENKLPQKLFLLHEFRLDMITHRDALDTTHAGLATVIQMDGSGNQQEKHDTWQAITQGAPKNVLFGWKNFYHQDTPMLTPVQTMKIVPTPVYISYQ